MRHRPRGISLFDEAVDADRRLILAALREARYAYPDLYAESRQMQWNPDASLRELHEAARAVSAIHDRLENEGKAV